MIIRLFDVQNGKAIPTEHCYILDSLKAVMESYPETYMSVYQYIFYMTCPNPDMTPFFNVPESEKEELIIEAVLLEESPEDEVILRAIATCNKLYETPTYRAYRGIKSMLDRLAKYMETTPISHGRDGNINSLVAAAKNFEQIRASFKGAYKDLQEEQSSRVRGGIGMAYDQ